MDNEGIYSERPLTLDECRRYCGKPHYPCRELWKPCAMPSLSAHERLVVAELLHPLSRSEPIEAAVLERVASLHRSVRARLLASPSDVRLAIAHQQLSLLRGRAHEIVASRNGDDGESPDQASSARG